MSLFRCGIVVVLIFGVFGELRRMCGSLSTPQVRSSRAEEQENRRAESYTTCENVAALYSPL